MKSLINLVLATLLASTNPQPTYGQEHLQKKVSEKLALLKDKDPLIRARAAEELAFFAKDRKQPIVVAALVAATKDEDARVRTKAVSTLGLSKTRDKSAFDSLKAALSDTDHSVRVGAVHALFNIGAEPTDTVPFLVGALSDKHEEVRFSAVRVLRDLRTNAKPALPQLFKALSEDKDPSVRREAAHALEAIDPTSKDIEAALLSAMVDPDKSVRGQAVRSLAGCGTRTGSQKVKTALLSAFNDADGHVRAKALAALSEIKLDRKEMMPLVLQATQDKSAESRATAIFVLGELAKSREEHVGTIILALEDSAPEVRYAAIMVLWGLEYHKTQIELFIRALEDKDVKVKSQVIHILGDAGTAGRPTVERLTVIRDKDPNKDLRNMAKIALEMIKNGGKKD